MMNTNELFYFKTVHCGNKETHDYHNCYFYHRNKRDKRRLLIDIGRIMIKQKEANPDGVIDVTDLNLYSNQVETEIENNSNNYNGTIRFECDMYNLEKQNFFPSTCLNLFEYKYHIFNYKKTVCILDRFNVRCVNKFCAGLHNWESTQADNSNTYENIAKFSSTYHKLLKSNPKLQIKEILEIIHELHSADNQFVDSKTLLTYFCIKNQKNKSDLFNIAESKFYSVIGLDNLKKNLNSAIDILTIKNEYKKILDENLMAKTSAIENLPTTENFSKKPCIKSNIYDELKNIPILTKEIIYSSIINTDNQIVFLSNSVPKKDELNQLLIAMLNSHNGVIIYGVDVNTNKFTGIKMNSKSRDLFRQVFNSEYKSIFIEYENCIKYKFYGLDDPNKTVTSKDQYCIIVFKIKKVKDKKIIFDPTNKAYVIKPKFLKKFGQNKEEKIKISDIKLLNMKAYIEVMKERLINHYVKEYKFTENNNLEKN